MLFVRGQPSRARALGLALLTVAACAPAPDAATVARELCVAIIADTTPLRVDTLSLFGVSTEGAEVIVERLAVGRERMHATYFGEQGRLTHAFMFRDDSLVSAQENTAGYDRPLSGMVVDSTPLALMFVGTGATWFWTPTAADTAAGRIDSLPAITARLRAQADSLRMWVQRQRNMQATRTP